MNLRMNKTNRLKKTLFATGAAIAVGVGVSACGSADSLGGTSGPGDTNGADTSPPAVITVGSADFTESQLLAYIYADALEQAGFKTEVKPNIGSREVTVPALQDGSLDVMPEYAGSLLAYLNPEAEAYETQEIIDGLNSNLPEGFTILDHADAENKDVKVVTADFAAEHNLTSIEDLAPIQDQIVFGGPAESPERRAGLLGLKEVYGIDVADHKPLDTGGPLTVAALNAGDVQVAQMFSTQPAITENNFVVLDDPLNIATAENIVPLVRTSALTPELEEVLNKVTASLTTETLIELNTRVDVGKEEPRTVAKDYVASLDL